MRTQICYFIAMLAMAGCEEKVLEPISESLGKPGVVTEIQTKPTPGGVEITYRIPEAEDILSVKGVYTLSSGKTYEANTSFYENKLEIAGYNDQLEHTVTVFAINRAQEKSDPVSVSFTPMESSLSRVSKTMEIVSAFGGAQYSWLNPDNAPLTFEFLAQDSLGEMKTMKIITSRADTVKQALRGYEPEERIFAALIRDNWENASDTVFPPGKTILPLFEEKLDKGIMSVMKLGSDASFTNFEGADAYLIDDVYTNFGHSQSSTLPAAFTIDLGVTAKLSRLVMHQRDNQVYAWGNPKNFEVYGSDHRPDQSGNWADWVKIMHCTVIKPSGSPLGTNTDEDVAALKAGHEFAFDLSQAPLRYVRIRVLDTWAGATFTHPAEVTFYGEVVE
ncbi:MAG: DUF5000 domain-containing lipoprotein [Prolixibacteraceae bacterium]